MLWKVQLGFLKSNNGYVTQSVSDLWNLRHYSRNGYSWRSYLIVTKYPSSRTKTGPHFSPHLLTKLNLSHKVPALFVPNCHTIYEMATRYKFVFVPRQTLLVWDLDLITGGLNRLVHKLQTTLTDKIWIPLYIGLPFQNMKWFGRNVLRAHCCSLLYLLCCPSFLSSASFFQLQPTLRCMRKRLL